MDTLMELVKTGTEHHYDYHNTHDFDKITRLTRLGLHKVAQKYLNEIHQKTLLRAISELKIIKISEEQIHQYLDRKVGDYNNKHASQQQQISSYRSVLGYMIDINRLDWNVHARKISAEGTSQNISSKPTMHFRSNGKDTIGQFCWTETEIKDYEGIPPEFVLKKIEQHKKNFDYITIAKVNEVKDPLLLGRINGCTDRFFLAQWGEDVKLDDII